MKKIFYAIYYFFEDFCQRSTTIVARFLANNTNQRIKNLLINIFLQKFEVNMRDATIEDPFSYKSFNDFFTRSLKPTARIIDQSNSVIVSPVDGTISESGKILNTQLFQAKGIYYELSALLNHKEQEKTYQNGSFVTIYLAPTDYHRIHLPYTAELISMSYVPGRLYPVKPEKVATVSSIFAINERLICNFNSSFGKFSLVMVGAQLVSGLETVWHGPIKENKPKTWDYKGQQLIFNKGQEIGRFNFGSTVVLCFEKQVHLLPKTTKQRKVLLGNPIANINK